jgi:fumarylacetoacetase
MRTLDSTHDPALKSWVDSANRPDGDFPIQNLPFAVFRRTGTGEPFRCGVAIGEQVLDLAALAALHPLEGRAQQALSVCAQPALNGLMALGREAWDALRQELSRVLRAGAQHADRVAKALVPQPGVEFALPARIGDYTDFYTSIHHATAVGRQFRPDQPLLPNYKWMPIAYHGRASSIGVSGQPVRRPCGQLKPQGAAQPKLAPTERLDYELEVGVFIGTGNPAGEPIAIEQAEEHVFGLCLLNDWSARDVQAWEYQPLGPFLGKNFATTVSPWVVTLEALAPFRLPWSRPHADPQPLPYLDGRELRSAGAVDLELTVWLETARMRAQGTGAEQLSRCNFRDSYWSIAQMVVHHSVNGCNLQPGDLFGSGTQSGPQSSEAGSLLELTAGGRQPFGLADGETRTFLADGDRVILKGHCARLGFAPIGFGEAAGIVLPANGAGRC